jgi:hypothetical protein
MSDRKHKAVLIPERGERPQPQQPLIASVGSDPQPRFVQVGKDEKGRPVYAPVHLWRSW